MTRKAAILSAMLTLMLAACSSPRTPALDARQVQRFEAQGFPPRQQLGTEPLDEVRPTGGMPQGDKFTLIYIGDWLSK